MREIACGGKLHCTIRLSAIGFCEWAGVLAAGFAMFGRDRADRALVKVCNRACMGGGGAIKIANK
ncbi:MAG: hypothetical protein Q7J47_20445 [Azoarcus sp.]|nr:hypothetical protein [Azoarcus sp.]